MTGEQIFGAVVSLVILALSLVFNRLLKQGDDRHTTAVAAQERALAACRAELERQIKDAEKAAEERLKHAREQASAQLAEHGRMIDHLRASFRSTNNVVSELRLDMARAEAEDAAVRRFTRANDWRERRPPREDGPDDG